MDDEVLERLDILEAHPDFYIRREVEIELLLRDANGNGQPYENKSRHQILDCGAYFLHDFHEMLLSRPLLDNYSSYGTHGLRYVLHEDRDAEQDSKSQVKKFVEEMTV